MAGPAQRFRQLRPPLPLLSAKEISNTPEVDSSSLWWLKKHRCIPSETPAKKPCVFEDPSRALFQTSTSWYLKCDSVILGSLWCLGDLFLGAHNASFGRLFKKNRSEFGIFRFLLAESSRKKSLCFFHRKSKCSKVLCYLSRKIRAKTIIIRHFIKRGLWCDVAPLRDFPKFTTLDT